MFVLDGQSRISTITHILYPCLRQWAIKLAGWLLCTHMLSTYALLADPDLTGSHSRGQCWFSAYCLLCRVMFNSCVFWDITISRCSPRGIAKSNRTMNLGSETTFVSHQENRSKSPVVKALYQPRYETVSPRTRYSVKKGTLHTSRCCPTTDQ